MEEIKDVITLPLTDEQLDKWFDNISEYHFNINYDKSSLKGKNFLNYVYNANIDFTLLFDDVETLEEILIEYVKFDRLKSISTLDNLWSMILLYTISEDKPQLDKDIETFIVSFINKHELLVNKLISFFFSFNTLLPHINEENKESLFTKTVTEDSFSINVITLCQSSIFWDFFSHLQNYHCEDLYFYDKFFNEPIFEGMTILGPLLQYFNPISATILLMEEYNGSSDKANE